MDQPGPPTAPADTWEAAHRVQFDDDVVVNRTPPAPQGVGVGLSAAGAAALIRKTIS